jgi:polysaccharide biosynthesis transport protein
VRSAFMTMLLQFGQTNMESQSGQTDVSILNPATTPLSHASPKIMLNILLSIFLGALLGVGFAVVTEMLDRRVRSSEDLFKLVQFPVLADLSVARPKMNISAMIKDWFGSGLLNKRNKYRLR